MRRRLNMPINIDDAHEQEPGSEPNQSPRLALQLRESNSANGTAKWNTTRNRPPFPIRHSCGVYTGISSASCRPDNQPLREIEVSPDHDEGEHELAMVVDFRIVQ